MLWAIFVYLGMVAMALLGLKTKVSVHIAYRKYTRDSDTDIGLLIQTSSTERP